MEETYERMCRRKSKQTCHLSSVLAIVLLVLIIAPTHVDGQFQAMVKRVTAETKDGIRFTVWVNEQAISLEQRVTIYYEVENRSNKTIYLVQKEGELETSVDAEALNIPFVIPFSDDSSGYQYNFTKVQRGKRHKGQLVIPVGKFNKEQTWLVNVSFGFVTDTNGLDRKLRPNEDPAPFRGLLGERILLVGLNGLVIEVEET